MSNNTYRISFTGRDQNDYYLTAKSANGKSKQDIGRAYVRPDGIVVTTLNGLAIGIVANKAEAVNLIDAYHRSENADGYWMWAKDVLVVGKR